LLILSGTSVSFAHGSNDGQKGMGLIMLILIGTAPTASALDHAVDNDRVQIFTAASLRARKVSWPCTARWFRPPAIRGRRSPSSAHAHAHAGVDSGAEPPRRRHLPPGRELRARQDTLRPDRQRAQRSRRELLSLMSKRGQPALTAAERDDPKRYKAAIDNATKFIPTWVKVAVAVALGLAMMIGWMRIVLVVPPYVLEVPARGRLPGAAARR
jgi:PiT family inorganic phosphate transporter